jgi:hypothetical protein
MDLFTSNEHVPTAAGRNIILPQNYYVLLVLKHVSFSHNKWNEYIS